MPFNHPLLVEWSEVDWLREAAWLNIEWEPPQDEDDLAAEDDFDEELELAAAGRWEELGLDPPGDGSTSTGDTSPLDRDASPNAGAFQPSSVEEFLST